MTNRTQSTGAARRRTAIDADRTTSAAKAARDVGPVVYAVRTDDGLIKIGHTTQIYTRLMHYGGLRVLLGLRPGTREDEAALHAQLRPHLVRKREYYRPTPEVLAVVNEMRAANRQDPIAA